MILKNYQHIFRDLKRNIKCVFMDERHKILVTKQSLEISFPSIDSRLKQVFVFFWPPEVVNFCLKSLLETTFAHSKQICSFDDGDTHTRSIDLVGVESGHSAVEVKDSQMKPETPNVIENPASETSRPLTTSSLVVGGFAAKKGSLRSPRGRLVGCLPLKI